MNFLGSLLLDVSRMLPPERSPCKMLRLCKYARALAISFAVSLRGVSTISIAALVLSAFSHSHHYPGAELEREHVHHKETLTSQVWPT